MTGDVHPNRDPIEPDTSRLPEPTPRAEMPLGPLLRQLSDDGRTLIRQEVALAGLEARQSAMALVKEVLLIGAGGVLILLGLLLLLVFVVLGLGRLLGGNYWLSTLIVGGAFVAVGLVVTIVARQELRSNAIKPRRAIESARETKEWAESKIDGLKRNIHGTE